MEAAKLTVPVLREHLAKRGLDTSGLKAVLVARLKDAIAADAASPPAAQGDSPAAAEPTPAAPAAAAPVAEPPAAAADEVQPVAAASRPGRRDAGRAKGAAKGDKAAVEKPAPTASPADAGPEPMETEAPEPAAQEVPQVVSAPAETAAPMPQPPVAVPAAAAEPASRQAPREKAAPGPASLTVRELNGDKLTELAAAHWRVPDGQPRKAFDDKLVQQLYASELGGGSRLPNAQRLSLLEISQYLESYLWPNFSESASATHVLSIMMLVNAKIHEGLAAWSSFADAEKFGAFFKRVLSFRSEAALSVVQRTAYLVFIINLFQSLENEMVRTLALPLVSLPLWHSLSPGRLQVELVRHPQLEKHWKHLQRKEAKAAKQEGYVPMTDTPQAAFLPALLDEFVGTLQEAVGADGNADAHKVAYCERFVEFLTDMLSQLPTRRFVRTVLEDRGLLPKCRLSPLFAHPKGRLFVQLVDLFKFYVGFEVDDHTGAHLSDDEMSVRHYDRLQQLQRLAFKHWPQLRELALSNCAAIEKRSTLTKHLQALSTDELRQLAVHQLRLAREEEPWCSNRPYLLEVLVSGHEKRRSQRQAISDMPVYPNEDVLWDENLVPSGASAGDSTAVALPKLNLQFLTLHDYLLRNFNLFRLEATYHVREDLADVLARVAPVPHPEGGGRVVFSGWARMAVPPMSVGIVDVRKPNVGETKPAAVIAEVRFDLASLRPAIRSEWDQLRQHDVLFLLAIQPPTAPASSTASPAERFGLRHVRGCEVIELRDADGKPMNDPRGNRETQGPPRGTQRTLVVALDAAQYQLDVTRQVESGAREVYSGLNLLVRRKPEENNFKAILECIRDMMQEDANVTVSDWLHDMFLGYGDPAAAHHSHMPDALATLDAKDTFLDAQHLEDSFPGRQVVFTNVAAGATPSPPFRLTFPELQHQAADGDAAVSGKRKADEGVTPPLKVEAYIPPDPGPYPEDVPPQNAVRFTPVQVQAVLSGLQPGLTMLVGPPGTGKTDTAVQLVHTLYHNFPQQRTLIITHSNAALNDLFQKLMLRDVPARYLLRLGAGEQELDTDLDFSRQGRVNATLQRRLDLLAEVERLAQSLGVPDDVAYTCETAAHFWLLHVLARWEAFTAAVTPAVAQGDPSLVASRFPFAAFFMNAPGQPLFGGTDGAADLRRAKGCFRHLQTVFTELEEFRAFELLKGGTDRGDYLLTRQAKIVAMTCTHAALKRHDFLRLGFQFDSLVMEESAQVLEIETFIPMVLQRTQDGGAHRLRRVVLLGDHHQLPPVIKSQALQQYSHMDQSLFTRFVRLSAPRVQLDAQGRARPSLASLYNWRYSTLRDLPCVLQGPYAAGNAGFAYTSQFVDVPDLNGVGEMEPTPHFVQNLGEAEYLVSVYQYMRLLGHPAHSITMLTTYRGQANLLQDVVARRCASHPLFGSPAAITTVDKYQGQQNDIVLLSLVRTRVVGHLRDVRRLVVALSRARLGLYVFGRQALFAQCIELQPAMSALMQRPSTLALLPTEHHPTERGEGDVGQPVLVEQPQSMAALVESLAARWQSQAAQAGAAAQRGSEDMVQ